MNEQDKLTTEINSLLRGLRSCDTQATAVAWMARAYKAMEQSLQHVRQEEQQSVVFMPERPKLEIVQAVPKFYATYIGGRRVDLKKRSSNETVVYPSVFLPPGLKPLPKAWTREDTLRLERAAKQKPPMIQRRGQ